MGMSNERIETLANYLISDKERAQTLLQLSPEEATVRINKDGFDYTVDEIVEFGEKCRKLANNEELKEEDLKDVAGGGWGRSVAIVVAGAVVGGAIAAAVIPW